MQPPLLLWACMQLQQACAHAARKATILCVQHEISNNSPEFIL